MLISINSCKKFVKSCNSFINVSTCKLISRKSAAQTKRQDFEKKIVKATFAHCGNYGNLLKKLFLAKIS